jgi:hypothetical protein
VTARADLERHLRAIQTAGQGVVKIHMLTPDMAAPLLLACAAGSDEAWALARAVEGIINRVSALPRRRPLLCAVCPAPLRSVWGLTIIVAAPDVPDTVRPAVSFAACAKCSRLPDLQQRVQAVLRQAWPEGRMLDVSGQVGNA